MITNLLVILIFPPSSYTSICFVRVYFDVDHYGFSHLQDFDVAYNLSACDLFNGAFSLQLTQYV